jgi:hypothetical protein
MDRSAFHELDPRSQLLEARGDLVRCLVGEREDADSVRVDSKILDEESNALDEAKGLACAGAGQDENRPQGCLNRLALRGGRNARRSGRDRRVYGDDCIIFGQARDRSRQGLVVL